MRRRRGSFGGVQEHQSPAGDEDGKSTGDVAVEHVALATVAPLPQPVDQLLAAVLLRAVRQQACELAAGPEEAWGPLSVHAQLRLAVVGGV